MKHKKMVSLKKEIKKFRKQIYSDANNQHRLDLLKWFSTKIVFRRDRDDLKKMRAEFSENSRFFNWRQPCFVCHGKCQCRHHLIQLQYGGDNRKENIVGLCRVCHDKVHPWMPTLRKNVEMDLECKAIVVN